jgi:hypothetical protein
MSGQTPRRKWAVCQEDYERSRGSRRRSSHMVPCGVGVRTRQLYHHNTYDNRQLT